MLRGVNKSIIEVFETENKYFEKAILFVRAEHKDKENAFLHDKATEYLSKISYNNTKNSQKTKFNFPLWAKWGSAASVCAAIVGLFAWLI